MSEPEESPAVPDSTTREQRLGFSHGEDVLLQHKDGKYYLGTIVEVDLSRERCLVKFLDNTSAWSTAKELTKLAMPDSDVMCVLCKKSQPKSDNDIVVCDKCGRGYHQLCHQPHVSKEDASPDSHWMCKRCVDCQPRVRESGDPKNSMIKANIRKVCSGRDQPEPPPQDLTKLPYDPEMLTWDTHHRVNAEQIYCYCGLNGEWYTQMLQCARCKMWFHEKCVSCLTHPLYSGDRFYVFVCSTCNYGNEFVRRLELKWVDLVHLMLYNLTVYNAKKYYDLDTVIIPYAMENWNSLQLPPNILQANAATRRESILQILCNNRNRFKCGREIKKRTTIWGLRVRLPPPCPVVNLPSTGLVDDSVLRRCWGGNKRLQYLLPPESSITIPESTKPPSPIKQSPENVEISVHPSDVVMRGTVFQSTAADQSTCPSPSSKETATQSLRDRYSGGGFVKKSFPFPKLSLQRRRRLMALGSSRERMLRKHKKREKGCVDTAKAQGVREARYRKARKLLKNAIAKSKTRSPEVSDLPPTPPTSVSGPPTPPATTSAMSELSVPSSVDLMHPLPPSTPADTSGDETSSRGTLDSFIPPPKDFEGKNNPFRNLSELLGTPVQSTSSTPLPYSQPPITLPLPLTPVISQPPIVRPAKRQLSEKDIIIDRNGQVKRRRQHRRGRPPQQPQQQQFQTTASKTAAILPARSNEVKGDFVRNLRSSFNSSSSSTNSQIANCVDYALNGRRLRQRQSNEKLVPPEGGQSKSRTAPTSPKCSPVKQNAPDISMDDLKSSVNMYFGAANRIASGEKFVVRAKRIGPEGQLQYLIEWDGPKT
ncbi:metal-response element-binding transcription factor 2 isoform X1 [Diachasma alloeum]|uniref:metal-response element-binding transcription factor 2 isoform X1 n=1 Tax=Diachasma alloeum TaxID=454923 RepID=UPI0007382B31|nr:metal-response element-binding transcription factor 2 isoform X1 [Diachasma alloeum]XP_015108630.1 metal-response element-binding transcription factor 2 isoform X1 [Diachasma alloeum]XP_015108631.1 metal-response element-binding transcription factor 2 isoform X1 [Diachasma alloeum]